MNIREVWKHPIGCPYLQSLGIEYLANAEPCTRVNQPEFVAKFCVECLRGTNIPIKIPAIGQLCTKCVNTIHDYVTFVCVMRARKRYPLDEFITLDPAEITAEFLFVLAYYDIVGTHILIQGRKLCMISKEEFVRLTEQKITGDSKST